KPDLVLVPDRAHNVYFQTGAETGGAGFLIYLGLWSIAAVIAIKVILSSDHNGRRMLGIASLAAIGIYAVDSFFSFPNEFITHSLFVALALGIAVGVYEKILPQDSSKAPMLLPMRKACLSLVVLFLLFCAYLGYSKEKFEFRMRNALTYEKLKRYEMIPAEVEAGRSSLVTLSPRGMPLEYYNAVAYVSLGQPDRALAAIQH